jgi:hypothetical protein
VQRLLEIATDFTAMLRSEQFAAAGAANWADEVTSIEPYDLLDGIAAKISGIEAVRAKTVRWLGSRRVHDVSIDGPFVTGNQFAVFLDMIIADPRNGANQPFSEIAVFTVCEGRIIEERFFYDGCL